MKLATAQITSFLAAPPASIRAVLVYGPDAGLVRERALLLAKKICADLDDPFSVSRLSSDQAADPARLYDEMAAQSLMGGRRLVFVRGAGENMGTALTKLIEDPPLTDSFLVIEAGDLDKRSKLRGLAEGDSPLIAAVPCYLDDAAARQRLIGEIFKAEGIAASRDLVAYLADLLPPDRGAMRGEVDKLALYLRGETTLTMEAIRAVIQDASGAEIDDLIQAVAMGEPRRVAQLLDHLVAEQTAPVAIIRAAQRHFQRLHLARSHHDRGFSPADSIGKLQPKVFWKQADSMARQLSRWPLPALEKFLLRLTEAEAALKKTGTPDQALLSQTLLAAAARGKGGG